MRLRRLAITANSLDAVTTLVGLHFGAVEANPIMRAALGVSPFLFLAVKGLVNLGLFKVKDRKLLLFVAVLLSGTVLWNVFVLLRIYTLST